MRGLAIKKTADRKTVGIGKEVNYTITYRNIGIFEAEELRLEEQPGPSVTLSVLKTIPLAEYSGGLLTWSLGKLPPGDQGKVSLLESVESAEGYEIKNTATVSAMIAGLSVSASASEEVKMARLLVLSREKRSNYH